MFAILEWQIGSDEFEFWTCNKSQLKKTSNVELLVATLFQSFQKHLFDWSRIDAQRGQKYQTATARLRVGLQRLDS